MAVFIIQFCLREAWIASDMRTPRAFFDIIFSYQWIRSDLDMETLAVSLRNADVWHSNIFWEVAFYDTLDERFTQGLYRSSQIQSLLQEFLSSPESQQLAKVQREMDSIFETLSRFAYHQTNLAVHEQFIRGFHEKMSLITQLDTAHVSCMRSSI